MLAVKVLILELGLLLVYAGLKGKSVGRLIRGDNTTAAPQQSIQAAA